MPIFDQWFSNLHFPSQCLFFERAADFKISLYYNKNVCRSSFIVKVFFIMRFFIRKVLPRNFDKLTENTYNDVSLSLFQ